ncbi:MAG: acyl-CoA dehydrogenase, partial [Acidobacteria bacterium]|nr:acyl-CoA dehydrogenase [Acidobacteriota bacterium]
MDLNDTPEQAEYRAGIRAWLDEHKDEAPVLQGEGAITDPDEVAREQRKWQAKLAEGGLAGAT